MLDQGRYTSLTERSTAEQIGYGHLGRLLRLTLLVPGLVGAMLNCRQPWAVTLPRLLEGCRWGGGSKGGKRSVGAMLASQGI
jgi:hypothetical protein